MKELVECYSDSENVVRGYQAGVNHRTRSINTIQDDTKINRRHISKAKRSKRGKNITRIKN